MQVVVVLACLVLAVSGSSNTISGTQPSDGLGASSAVGYASDGSPLIAVGAPYSAAGGYVEIANYTSTSSFFPSVNVLQTISGLSAGDLFGTSIAILNGDILVGAPQSPSNTSDTAGYVYWVNKQIKILNGTASGDQFGYTVTAYGSTLAVSSLQPQTGAGFVNLYSCGPNFNCTLAANLTVSGVNSTGDQFGFATVISGTNIIVGAPGTSGGVGAAYLFICGQLSKCSQPFTFSLSTADANTNLQFGYALSASQSIVAVSAYSSQGAGTTGLVYVYSCSANACGNPTRLVAADGASGDNFGHALAITTSFLFVGASSKSTGNGEVYVYDAKTFAWKISFGPNDGTTGGNFGSTLAALSFYDLLIVGAPAASSNAGEAYLFDLINIPVPTPTPTPTPSATSPPPANATQPPPPTPTPTQAPSATPTTSGAKMLIAPATLVVAFVAPLFFFIA